MPLNASKLLCPTALLCALLSASSGYAQSETSTSGFRMPEEGGPLPRAPMPQGGVETPFKRTTPEGGTGRDMKHLEHCHEHKHKDGTVHKHCHDHLHGESHEHSHKDEHCHEHEHKDGTVHSHCHEKGKDGHNHEHGAGGALEHCHEHEHDGKKHKHCHEHPSGPGHEHSHANEHCHSHEHDGKAHEHCHEHPGGPEDHEHTHTAQNDPVENCHEHTEDGQSRSHCHEGGSKPHAHGDEKGLDIGFLGPYGLRFSIDGYLRVLAEVTENDPRSTFIGRNDGFRLGRVRLGTNVAYKDFRVYISLEAAAGVGEGFNNPNQQFAVRPRDAFLNYDFSQFASIRLGRFRTPYDLLQIKPAADWVFIDTPVYSRGVLPTQGNQLLGMSQDRQLGVAIFSEKVGFTKDRFDLAYALALTNGRTFNLALNDNDKPAGFLRLSMLYGQYFRLNVAGFTDTQTVGELPNLFDEDVKGLEGSMSVKLFGIYLEGQVLFQNRQFETSGQADVNSLGWHVQLAYTFWGITGGYRYAFYDPNMDDLDDADAVQEHTIVLNYQVPDFPLSFAAQGTVANEQTGRKLKNNRLNFLAQFRF